MKQSNIIKATLALAAIATAAFTLNSVAAEAPAIPKPDDKPALAESKDQPSDNFKKEAEKQIQQKPIRTIATSGGDNKEVKLDYGEKVLLTVLPKTKLEWTSSEPTIVTVTDKVRQPNSIFEFDLYETDTDQGIIRGIRTGTAVVRAKDDHGVIKAEFRINVGEAPKPTKAGPYFRLGGGNESTVIAADKLLADYPKDDEWIALVPKGSPRMYVNSPVLGSRKSGTSDIYNQIWTWDPLHPNQIIDSKTGVTFIQNTDLTYTITNPKNTAGIDLNTLQPKFTKVKVMNGDYVSVPYWEIQGTHARTLVQARMDFCKLTFTDKIFVTLTQAYYFTKDENKKYQYARRCALLLDEYAKNLQHFYVTNSNNANGGNPQDIDAMPAISQRKLVGGAPSYNSFSRISNHNGFSGELRDSSLLAFDMIYNTQALSDLSKERGYDLKVNIGENYFASTFYFLRDYIPLLSCVSSNLKSNMQTTAKLAIIMNRPDMIEWVSDELALEKLVYFRRDFTCGGSFQYQKMAARQVTFSILTLPKFLAVYPDYKKSFPELVGALDQLTEWSKKINYDSTEVAYPNGIMAPAGDSSYIGAAARKTTSHKLLPAFGFAMLGAGSDSLQTQLNLSALESGNHIHSDKNAITLYAFGKELMGDVRYVIMGRPERGSSGSTAAHNTASISVFDKASNKYKEDRINSNQSHACNLGNISLFQPEINGISIMEMDAATRLEVGANQRNQRTLILNTIDQAHPYVLDLFRLGGGQRHDYVLHGATDYDQTSSVGQGIAMQPVDNSTSELFSNKFFKNMLKGISNGNFDIIYRSKEEPNYGLRTIVVGDTGSSVYLGESMVATRPKNGYEIFWRPAMIVRHEDTNHKSLQSLYVSVIEPLNGESNILSVSKLDLDDSDYEHVALSVKLKDGREDTFLVNMNDMAITGKPDKVGGFGTKDGKYALDGRIGIVSKKENTERVYLTAGRSFKYNDKEFKRDDLLFSGKILGSQRTATGAENNAFITHANLPSGDALKDKWLSLTFGTYHVIPKDNLFPKLLDGTEVRKQNGMLELYQIDHIEKKDGKTYIIMKHDHVLDMKDGKAVEAINPTRTFEGYGTFEIRSGASDLISK